MLTTKERARYIHSRIQPLTTGQSVKVYGFTVKRLSWLEYEIEYPSGWVVRTNSPEARGLTKQ